MTSETSETKPEETPRKFRGKIVYSFLLVLVTVGLLPLGAVAYKLIDISRESLVTSQQEVQLQIATSMARQLDASVRAVQAEMARVAEGIDVVSRTTGLSAEARRAATRQQLDGGLGSRILLVRFSPRSGRSLEARQERFPVLPEVEEKVRDGLRLAGGEGGNVSEPVPVDTPEGQRALLVVTVPVGPRGGEGALTGVVDFSVLWEALAGGRRAAYTLYALDARGRMFAAQDDQGILQRSNYEAFGVVQTFRSAQGHSAVTTEFTLETGESIEEYLASFDTTEQGWGIFVQLRKAQAYAAVNQMIRTTLFWAGLAMMLALVLAYVLAATVTRPIKALAAGTHAFARGDLEHKVAVGSRNELGELAETFNSMARQLQDYIQRLKNAARLNNELFMGTIKALAEAIDEKDPYTRGHSDRVNRYAVLLARQMGLSSKLIREIYISSLFHDIGKIGIEDKILQKPAALTDQEFAIMKHHPEKGAQMLSPIKAMRDIIPGIRFHHERWDGSGYPLALKGEAIPLAARIVAVADAFDAMTTNRPYQKAMTFERAIARLRELSGRAYDRKVVEGLADAFRAGALQEPPATVVEVE
jgi:HD-GYP domain-containing protein (c-di-GMP phosphodiesterase class II)